MCIALFLWQAHPLYPFLLLNNRDEYHNRPTKAMSWWEDSDIVGGRDEIGGGTWLACSRDGRVAFLTNVLELRSLPEAKTRGDLPASFLKSGKQPKEFAESLKGEGDYYNGFNLIVADISSKSMIYITNRPKGQPIRIEEVSSGLHVLSNAKLDSPWHKAQRLEVSFKEELAKYGDGEIPMKEVLQKLMKDKTKADETHLPHIRNLDWEFNLSSIFVEVETPLGLYGTRSSAAIVVKSSEEVSFFEAYLEESIWKEHVIDFHIEKMKLAKGHTK
ncbi:transport and Golgi organization 2 homolog [Vigna unguiculata]|nr:transport and Golgi organization 2 homolog [Vigna unguiculata]XP_027938575.1 transport and Golgi organization 2 homolog [Vigna unguiculata]